MRRKSQSWADGDIQKLKELIADRVSADRAGVILKRTTHAVKNKARLLGMPYPRVKPLSYKDLDAQRRLQ